MKFSKSNVLAASALALLACGAQAAKEAAETTTPAKAKIPSAPPASKFDLSHWKITVPLDKDRNGKVDEIDVKEIQTYSHPDFFYLDENGGMVFAVPNKATTTVGSSNTRSELRYMLRGMNTKISTKGPGNNFTVAAHPDARKFASIGGRMQATLKVNHVSVHAKYPEKAPAFSVVVGQIHGAKDMNVIAEGKGFGWGNEPIKIYYKKWPDHKKGSVFWNYELNLEKHDPRRRDIAYPVWGNTWENPAEPGDAGIGLGEEFSYEINVHGNIMYLTFSAEGKETVKYSIDLSNNIDPYGKVLEDDNPAGYSGDTNYFKAGAYNQCSTKDDPGFWYTACPGTGDWETDKANGDYTSVTFSKLVVSDSVPGE